MYFFLANISVIDIFYTTNIVPQMLLTFLIEIYTISYTGCISQFFLHICFGSGECLTLAIMAFDRYVAICNPLHYLNIMNNIACISLIGGIWVLSLIANLPPLVFLCQMHFCGANTVNHFFCDAPPLLKLSCTSTQLVERINFVVAASMIMSSLTMIILSYSMIIRSVIAIPTTKGKKKAFSTCASHLTVVGIFFGSLIVMYGRPNYNNSSDYNKVVSGCYTMVTPMFNPLIYSFRNRDMKNAIKHNLMCKAG
ncbi:olfactory receptor 6M1-like [Bufo bufo]|uniref:olfactory receptor 6M1-like n=1 Tax=Bufo bufo TaxID=8384 RepID=UPI001ABE5579|nr:olfactory receptor 6M1-like [Bufo bufo]